MRHPDGRSRPPLKPPSRVAAAARRRRALRAVLPSRRCAAPPCSAGGEYTGARVIFLTGASGYVGLRVGERMAGLGRRFRSLVLPGDPLDPATRFPTQVVRGDVRELDSFAAYGDGVNAIVHAAAAMPPRARTSSTRSTCAAPPT